jgi:hypothetical protein
VGADGADGPPVEGSIELMLLHAVRAITRVMETIDVNLKA